MLPVRTCAHRGVFRSLEIANHGLLRIGSIGDSAPSRRENMEARRPQPPAVSALCACAHARWRK